ncbi:MAG: hypothetical protein AB7F59_01010 [Bdellovibrionales bacterium]
MRFWPLVLYVACEIILFVQLWLWEEIALAQLILLSQAPVIFLLKPFVFRNEVRMKTPITRQSKFIMAVLAALLVMPFAIATNQSQHSPSMLLAGHDLFKNGREGLLVLGFCLSALFVMAVLIQRRGVSRWK